MESHICRSSLLVVLALVAQGTSLEATELKPETARAWAAYIRATEQRISQELSSGASPSSSRSSSRSSGARFLVEDFQDASRAAEHRRALLAGEIFVAKMSAVDPQRARIPIPDREVHHWRGSVLIPGVKLSEVLARVQDPSRRD